MGAVPRSSSLSSLLSQALVAHTIEIDNEAEPQLPHRTTRGDDSEAVHGAPWLVSFPLWANVLQYLDGHEARTVADLRTSARTDRLLLAGLRRWGYVAVTPPANQPLMNPPQEDATVRARKGARRAMEVWRTLPAVVDERWRTRLGPPVVDRLERALRTIFGALTIDPPAYMPVIHPTQGGKVEQAPPIRRHGRCARTAPARRRPLLPPQRGAPRLHARRRVGGADGAGHQRQHPARAHHFGDAHRGPAPPDRRVPRGQRHVRRVAGTPGLRRDGAGSDGIPRAVAPAHAEGSKAQQSARRVLDTTEMAWRTRFGSVAMADLTAALEQIVGDGSFSGSPLAPGLVPYDGTWRAALRRPEALPHHPMVLHRGGYPDGS